MKSFHFFQGVTALMLCGCTEAGCVNTPYGDAPSPDGKYHVVVFDRDCNRGEPFSTHVSVLARSKSESGAGNILVVADRQRLPSVEGSGGPRVGAVWLDSHTLQLRFSSRVRVIQKLERYKNISIKYAYLDSLSRP